MKVPNSHLESSQVNKNFWKSYKKGNDVQLLFIVPRGVHGMGFLKFFGPGIFWKIFSRDFLVPGFLSSENPGIF